MKVILWKNKLFLTEIILLLIRQNTIPFGQRHYQSHEFCLVINLTRGGNWSVIQPPVFATKYLSFAFIPLYQVKIIATGKKS